MDSASATALASAMARTLLDTLSETDTHGQGTSTLTHREAKTVILDIALDLQTILGEAMATATNIFPQKPATRKTGALPHHL